MKPYTVEQKTEIIERAKKMNVTLDGEPATINGRLLAFAVVASKSKQFEWAWPTVQRVLNNGGQFKS
jgi:hypothetical protein